MVKCFVCKKEVDLKDTVEVLGKGHACVQHPGVVDEANRRMKEMAKNVK